MSDKSLVEKLWIRENHRVSLLNAPKNFRNTLGDLPKGATIVSSGVASVDVVLFFVTSKKELTAKLPRLKKLIEKGGSLWVVYPKGTSALKSDVNRDVIANYALEIGMKGVALVAADETWSALRLRIV